MAGFFLDEDILAFRYGEIYMDNVEIYNMSQIDTFKAAIRWENNLQGHSSVTNCAFHNGYGWAGVLGLWSPLGNMADLQARSELRTVLDCITGSKVSRPLMHVAR